MTNNIIGLNRVPLSDLIKTNLELKPLDVVEFDIRLHSEIKGSQNPNRLWDYATFVSYRIDKQKYISIVESEKENLKTIFSNKIVVDLGCSTSPFGYFIAFNGDASYYIGIDVDVDVLLFLDQNIKSSWTELNNGKKPIPYAILHQEMLSFLEASKQVGKKCSFIASHYGDDNGLFSAKFFNMLRFYIEKCTIENGGVLQYNNNLNLEGFQTLENKNKINKEYCFLKK